MGFPKTLDVEIVEAKYVFYAMVHVPLKQRLQGKATKSSMMKLPRAGTN